MAQHNSSQTLHQSQSQQQQQQHPSQQHQQQQSQQNNVVSQQVVSASQQNNNLTANYPHHHYQMPGNVYVPTASPHGGAIYSVMPASLPGNVFVNNVTANVNLHGGWAAHTAYIPAGQTFMQANNEIQQNVASMEPVMQSIVNQQNNTIPRNGNRRNRNNPNPRNNNGNRRNDYNQRGHINSPAPQDIANANGLDPNSQALNQGYHHSYGYPQFACPQPQFFNHVPPQQVSHSQAQQATGAPLYLTSMYTPGGPFFNYPLIISSASPHMLQQSAPQSQEYQLGDERNVEGVDQHGQPIHINVAGNSMMQPHLWAPHEIPIEYQEEYHVMGSMTGNEGNDEMNHNTAVSITDSDTPSMMSPTGYTMHYDPNLQIIETQQHMSSLQIYDQHATVNEEEIHQQQIIHEQQSEHYPRIHEQVVMISHEVNVYEPEPVCERNDMIQEINTPLQQHIDQQNPYPQQYQQLSPEQDDCYQQQPQSHFISESENNLEYKDGGENYDYNQNVPNIEHENGIQQTENVLCVQETNLSTNYNESTSIEQNYDIQSPVPSKNHPGSEEHVPEFFPSKNYHSSPEALEGEGKVITITQPNVQIQTQTPATAPVVLIQYQPLPQTQTISTQSSEVITNQHSHLSQTKSASYVPSQIIKKTTASVAVTATPIQQHITTAHVGLPVNPIASNIKSDVNTNTSVLNTAVLQPKENVILHNQTVNGTPSGALPQRERRVQSSVQVEQKSIASTAVPHQIQENQQPNIISVVDAKKHESTINDQNVKEVEKRDDVLNVNITVGNKEIETKASAPVINQPPSGLKSWASLFATKSSNNSVPNSNISNNNININNKLNNNINNNINNNSNNNNNDNNDTNNNNYNNNNNPFALTTANINTSVNKKPIAKVSPFESTVNVQNNLNPGVLSYSAASSQGVLSSNKQSSTSTTSTSSSTVVNNKQNGSIMKSGKSNNQQIIQSNDNSDEWTIKYADFLKKYKTDFSPISLKSRGLKNPNNYCFINAVLQALIGCSPLYNLLKSAPKQSSAMHLDKSKIPTINAMSQLISEFNTLPFGVRLMNRRDRPQKQNQKQSLNNDELVGELQTDSAFEALPIYKLWNSSRPDVDEGRQGDAEEFLSYVLNKLNDEMLEVIKVMAKPVTQIPVQQNGNALGETDEGDDWQMIYNNRNKGSVTRQTDFGKTPISDIFRGELRSRLQREGEHSTDVIQPFFTLQLNIEKAGSVREALEILVGRDQLEGVTCSKTNQEVVAWQQMNLEKLPPILIVHLKFFDYKSDGCTKIVKQFEFPLELKIDTKILASKKYSAKQRVYRLFAVVYHDGKEAVKGHYISDVYHSGYANWLRYDDANVKPISEGSVLRPRGLRVPYLLFYKRCDTLPAIPTTSTPQQQQQQQQHQHGSTHSK